MAILNIIYNNPLRLSIAEFLRIELFTGFDMWTFVHFFSGFLIMFLLVKIFKGKDRNSLLITLLSILVIYEVYELANFLTSNRFFIPETSINQFVDLIVGGLGAITYLFLDKDS